jgi:hypothetical protein
MAVGGTIALIGLIHRFTRTDPKVEGTTKNILVIGAGPVGLMYCLLALKSGYVVTVIEERAGPGEERAFNRRPLQVGLSPDSWQFLTTTLGVKIDKIGCRDEDWYDVAIHKLQITLLDLCLTYTDEFKILYGRHSVDRNSGQPVAIHEFQTSQGPSKVYDAIFICDGSLDSSKTTGSADYFQQLRKSSPFSCQAVGYATNSLNENDFNSSFCELPVTSSCYEVSVPGFTNKVNMHFRITGYISCLSESLETIFTNSCTRIVL